MKNSLEHLYRVSWNIVFYGTIVLLVIAAVTLTLARILLPLATDYKADIEGVISELMHQPVKIEKLGAAWQGVEPQLVMDGVKFYSADGTILINQFAHARIGLDLLSSLLQLRLVSGALVVEGTRLILVRDTEGRFGIEGFGETSKPLSEDERRLLADWVLGQRILHVRKTQVEFRDDSTAGKPFVFPNITFTLRNSGQQHQIDGTFVLPAHLGSQIIFNLDLRGNILMTNTWSGNGYVAAGGLRVTEWLRVLDRENTHVQGGVISANVWTQWRSATLEDIRGEVTAAGLALRSDDSARLIKFDQAEASVAIEIRPHEWRITGDRIAFTTGVTRWPSTRFDARYRPGSNNVEGEIGYLNLADAARLYSIVGIENAEVEDALRAMKFEGDLESLTFFVRAPPEQEASFAASGRFRNVSAKPWKKIPGAEHVSGDFFLSNNDGFVSFDTESWRLDYPEMFRSPLPMSSLHGSIAWEKNDDTWLIYGNRVAVHSDLVSGVGRFSAELAPEKSPFLNVAVNMKSTNMGAAGIFIPANIMSPGVVEWIDSAIRGGRFNEGGLLYYGYLDEYPFDKNQGKFNVYINAQKMRLVYLPEWPEIEDIDGEFNLTSTGLTFSGNSGNIYSNGITSVDVSIPNFFADDVAVNIKGSVEGLTQEKLRFMHESPLEDMFASALAPFHSAGTSTLDIDLHIPLAKQGKFRVNGELHTRRNRFYSPEYNVDVRDLNIDLAFDEEGLYAKKSSGVLGPIPIGAKIDTIKGKRLNEIRITQETLLDAGQIEYILEHFVGKPQWSKYLKGAVNSYVEISIPIIKDSKLRKPVSLSVWSDMLGVSVTIPAPAAKESLDNKPLFLRYELSGPVRHLLAAYGDTYSLLEFEATKNDVILSRGVVASNAGPILPSENSYHFYGNVERFSWTEWDRLLFPSKPSEGLLGQGGASNPLYVDVTIGELEIFGAKYKQLALNASNASQGWTFHVDGADIAGTVIVPSAVKSAPLVLDMSRLYVNLPKSANEGDKLAPKRAAIDPRELPQAKIKIKDFRFNDKVYGSLDLLSTRTSNGVHLDKMLMDGPAVKVDASGDWTSDGNKQQSSFKINVRGKNFGEGFENWGYGKVLKGGEGVIDINAHWPGSPADFSFNQLTGKLNVKMGNAHFTDVNVGAVKMLGLFSLQALPRRIFFDFSDLTNKGLRFDTIDGNFDVQNGDAFSSGLLLIGPIGKMTLAGRIGLAVRDFDLVLTFVPPAFDTIPILGGLAAADPTLTGATIIVLQKFFQTQLEDISTVQYTVSGGWDSPVITRVNVDVQTPTNLLNEP